MKVLLIISQRAQIDEVKKIKTIINDLIKLKYTIYFLNTKKGNSEIERILLEKRYYKYHKIGSEIDWWETNNIYNESKKILFDIIIVVGLVYQDPLTKYLDCYIGTNTQIYVVAQNYGKVSDASYLINEGAYILCSIYDIKKF